MKKIDPKTSVILDYLAAACFFAAAIIGFINDKSFSALYLCLGSLWLCLGSAQLLKRKKDAARRAEDLGDPEDPQNPDTDR